MNPEFVWRRIGLLCLLALTVSSGVVGQVISGTIYGAVTDPAGALVPAASVTVREERTGITATTTTDALGGFTLSGLQPGTYTVSVEATGFRPHKQVGLRLDAGQRLRLNLSLEVGTVTEVVEVAAVTPLVNSVNAEQRSNLETEQVRELPASRRDWLTLITLAPGISTTSGRVRFNGLPSAGFRMSVDGTDSASDAEMPAVSMYQDFNIIKALSLEAIEEVNLARGIASAETGAAMSGNVNIITRRGTNEFHGSLFELNQTENLNARNQFLASKPGLVFNQFGGSLGGPVLRNKLFFFGVYEGYRLRGFQTLSGQVPTAGFRELALKSVPAYKPFFDLFPLPNTPTPPDAVTGLYQGAGSEKGRDNHGVLRADYHIRDSLILTARYTRGRPFRQIPRVALENWRHWTGVTEVGTLNLTRIGPRRTLETRFGANRNEVNRLDNIFKLGIAGIVGALGFSTAGETFFKEGTAWSLEQVVGTTLGRHSLRVGGILSRTLAGRDNVEVPELTYADVSDFLANIPSRVQVTFGVRSYQLRKIDFGFFLQDDFKITRRLTLNLGLRYDYFTVPEERDGRLFNRDVPFGMGPFLPADRIWRADRNNFSPRFGFAYALDESSRTVLRAGGGMFFSPIPLFGGVVDMVQNALDEPNRVIFSRADVLRLGQPLRYPVVNGNVLPLVKGTQGLIGGTAVDPGLRTPVSYQWLLSIQRQLSRETALEAAYVGNHGANLQLVRSMNPPDRVTGIRPNPRFGTFRYRDGSESTNYNALQLTFRKRFSGGLTAGGSYTWSRAMSHTGEADLLLPASVQDIWNVRSDYGPADHDVRQRFVADFVYELPLADLAGPTRRARLALGGWQWSGVLTAQTGSPVTVFQPSGLDSSRPDFLGGVAVLSDSRRSLQYLDPRVFVPVPLGSISRLPLRPGTAGRNLLYGHGLWNVDFALAKSFTFGESRALQLRLEMFNAFNHTNLAGIETRIDRGNFGRFTASRGARLVQLQARLSF
jgi:hypothetical protein